jgi:hypothetical protein
MAMSRYIPHSKLNLFYVPCLLFTFVFSQSIFLEVDKAYTR